MQSFQKGCEFENDALNLRHKQKRLSKQAATNLEAFFLVGDVYLVGCTNVGKSSLFNTLLRSDYCKVQAADLIRRATISPWPGTTLNVLKFPILNPVRWRLWMRTQRLMAERESIADVAKFRDDKFKETKKIKYSSLQGKRQNIIER